MSTLCGHERADLEWALRMTMAPTVVVSSGLRSGKTAKGKAMDAIHDPAKLAELMAEELRRRAVGVWLGPNEERAPEHGDVVMYAFGKSVRAYSPLGPGSWERQWTLPQARAALLRLMQLPEGTAAQDVLKALEVGT